jgi:hypothetical protein
MLVMAQVSLRMCAPATAALFGAGWLAMVPAHALSLEQAQATCRETVGHPIVHACMQGLKGAGGEREANHAKCRADAAPKARACVQAALNKANGRANVAITIDTGTTKEVIDLIRALPVGFVPPPRTITDITAILDKEKTRSQETRGDESAS